jgi:hypothetical protein
MLHMEPPLSGDALLPTMLFCQRTPSPSSLSRSPLLLFLQFTTLVRFEVRNEVALGDPDLYGGAAAAAAGVGKKGAGAGAWEEEPKALLKGVTIVGLVGILRQLGGHHWWPRPRFLGRWWPPDPPVALPGPRRPHSLLPHRLVRLSEPGG